MEGGFLFKGIGNMIGEVGVYGWWNIIFYYC